MTFQLLMIGAMYENGGNTTHRLLDGHPDLLAYPFESQLGTPLVRDHLSSMFPVKYRWPVFDLSATAEQDYEVIIDEETRVRARTPHVSKFRHVDFDFSDADRKSIYVELVEQMGRSRANNVEAFFRATFEAWRNRAASTDAAVDAPSWNGMRLEEVYPWGTIRRATPEANRATAAELPPAVRDEIRQRAEPFLASLDYAHFM